MDGTEDCLHGADERGAIKCDEATEFTCEANRRCLLRHRVNDNFNDCINNSDEHLQDFKCFDSEFDCGDGRCIPRWWVGNNIKDCRSGIDEISAAAVDCLNGEFACSDKSRCLPLRLKCDGTKDCEDASDEIELCDLPTFVRVNDNSLLPLEFIYLSYFFDSRTSLILEPLFGKEDVTKFISQYKNISSPRQFSFGLKCIVNSTMLFGNRISGIEETTSSKMIVPQRFVQNNISVCTAEEDRCHGSNSGGTPACTRCGDNRTIILKSQICDDIIDCEDLTDECFCERSVVEPLCRLIFNRTKTIGNRITTESICNGRSDRDDKLDERFCYYHGVPGVTDTKEANIHETVKCGSSEVVARYCDGEYECPNMEDECSARCLETLSFVAKDRQEIVRSYKAMSTCLPELELEPFDSFNWSDPTNRHYIKSYRKNIKFSDLEISTYVDSIFAERWAITVHLQKLLSHELKVEKPKLLFETVNYLCDREEFGCPWKVACSADSNISIEINQICDLKVDCPGSTDELGCADATHFYCADNKTMFVPNSKRGDGKKDCADSSDECILDVFSDKFEMIRNTFLRHFVWIAAVLSVLVNLAVIYQHQIKLRKRTNRKSLVYCNTLLLTNLALSDMLMGVSLLVVAVKSAEFSGVYCQKNYEWRTSVSCNFVGAMTIVSSQASMNSLVLLTATRLYNFNNPLTTIRLKHLYGLIAVAWTLSIALALVPILATEGFTTAYFTEANRYYVGSYVDRSVVDRNRERVESLFSQMKADNRTGEISIEDWLVHFPQLFLDFKGYFGYYSSNSVCFPDFFSTSHPALSLSFTIVFNNFCALVFICCSYLFILHKASRQVAGQSSRGNGRNEKMKKRVFYIILTDALCWTPIIITAFASYLGHQLPAVVHPLSAIVFLPINSVINPIIYSECDVLVKDVFKKVSGRVLCGCKRSEGSAAAVELNERL